jgi:hypothetical protein
LEELVREFIYSSDFVLRRIGTRDASGAWDVRARTGGRYYEKRGEEKTKVTVVWCVEISLSPAF